MNQRLRHGFSFLEVVIAFAILTACFIPVMNMFSTSGRAVKKSQNLGTAVGLAHRISQFLLAIPFDEIQNVPLPGRAIAGGPSDRFFHPVANFGSTAAGELAISKEEMPDLYYFLNKYDFRYALVVNNVTFGVGDEMKSVAVIVTWCEGNRNLLYKMQVYVPNM
jgi:hypothetical protein